jgi:phospholipid/cholesterol/gamma-HCH transport system substrate-binding protein
LKRDTVNYVAVGSFVLVMLGALAAGLLAITGRSGPTDSYFVYYHNVSGIRYGTPVYYQGYGIGQVSGIEPEHVASGTRYRVDLAVRNDWPIPKDSLAAVMTTGLLADVSISIVEGKSAERLTPGSELRGREGGDLFMAFNELAGEIQTLTRNSIRPLVDQLGSTLGEGGPVISDLRRLLAKLNEGADGLTQMLGPANQREVSQLLRRLNEASGNANQLSAQLLETRKQLDAVLAGADAMVEENRPEARQAVRELRVSLQAIAERIDGVMQQLDSTSRNLQEFSREIRANPNRLLSGTPPVDEARQ